MGSLPVEFVQVLCISDSFDVDPWVLLDFVDVAIWRVAFEHLVSFL